MGGSYVIRLDLERRKLKDGLLEQLEAEVTARGLGEVDAVMEAGGFEMIVWLALQVSEEALAERDIRPGLEDLLQELGLGDMAGLEWVEDDPDGDGEDDDLEDALAEEEALDEELEDAPEDEEPEDDG
jgi:hypothetical protein